MVTRVLAASLMAAALVAAQASAAVPTTDDGGVAVEAALAEHDAYKAAVAYQALVEARLPPKSVARPDPVLDRTLVDISASEGKLSSFVAILRRVVSDPATPNRDHYRLMLATYGESTGAAATAEQQYRALATDPKVSASDRLAADLGLARLQMIDDPGAALATLDSITPGAVPPADAWELDLLRARAASMAGSDKKPIAAAALDRAWSESVMADLTAAAPAHVAGDRALAAAIAGDRKTLVAMLAIDRYNRNANSGQSTLGADLPICGRGGIQPQDRVVIDVAHLPAVGRPAVTLVWSSRVGVAAPFLQAAEQSGVTVPDGRAAMFSLACRTAPSDAYTVRITLDDAIAGWMTSLGAYPLPEDNTSTPPSALASMLAERQARYGAGSVMLLPVLLRMMSATAADGYDDSARKQIAAISGQIGPILAANHAPADLAILWQMGAIGAQVLAQTKTPVDGQTEVEALLVKAASNPDLSLDMIYMLALNSARAPNTPASFKTSILSATRDLLTSKAPVGDPRTAAIALQLHDLRKSTGDDPVLWRR